MFQRRWHLHTIVGIEVNGMVKQVDITKRVGEFSPFFLVHCRNITELDVSDSTEIVPSNFVDCVVYARKLQRVVMDRCHQFSMFQFMKMFKYLMQMQVISLVQCQCLDFTAAYCLCTYSWNMREIDFEPRNVGNTPDWRRFRGIFFQLKIGNAFMSKFHGLLWRMPNMWFMAMRNIQFTHYQFPLFCKCE